MSFLTSLLNALPGAVAQGLIWGIMAIGVYITYRILDVADLTVDGSLATGGAVCVMLIRAGVSPWPALLCAMLAGMLAGLVTGLFHTKCGIPAILAGILTQLSLYSVNLRIMESKANQAVSVDKYDLLVSQRYVRTFSPVGELLTKNPLPLLLLFTAAVIALLYWFFGTEKGCSIRATGANQNMARAQGIDTSANVVLGLMLSNGLVALSGALLAQYQGSSDVQMGRGAIVIGLAAVIIGEVVFGKLFINFGLRLFAVSIGAILYYIVLQAALQLGLNTNDLKLVTALIVAVFIFKVAFDLIRTGVGELLEKSLPEETEREILRIVTLDPAVREPHNLRTRRIGAAIAIEIHIRVDGAMTVARSHALTVGIERRLRERFGEGTMIAVHVEPLK